MNSLKSNDQEVPEIVIYGTFEPTAQGATASEWALLKGPPDAWRQLAELVTETEQCSVLLHRARSTQDRPECIPVNAIGVLPGAGLLCVRRIAGKLQFSGSVRSRRILASTLNSLADSIEKGRTSPIPYHVHVEYFDGNEWIDPSSMPVVFEEFT